MGMGKHGQGSSNTVWMDLRSRDKDSKEPALVTWNKVEQREDHISYVYGRLTDVRVKERAYGGTKGYVVSLTLQDPESNERYIIATPASTRMACRLLGQLNSADLGRVLYMAPWMMKEGEVLQDGSVAKMDESLIALKYVLGKDGDRLSLSDGIRPYFNETFGSTVPPGDPVLKADGSPLVQNGLEVKDFSKRESLVAEMVQILQAKLRGDAQGQGQGQGDNGGVDPESVAAAAQAADRSAMRARG